VRWALGDRTWLGHWAIACANAQHRTDGDEGCHSCKAQCVVCAHMLPSHGKQPFAGMQGGFGVRGRDKLVEHIRTVYSSEGGGGCVGSRHTPAGKTAPCSAVPGPRCTAWCGTAAGPGCGLPACGNGRRARSFGVVGRLTLARGLGVFSLYVGTGEGRGRLVL